jgi:DNA-binding transcriptional regulator YdaS (Cro superfamily)
VTILQTRADKLGLLHSSLAKSLGVPRSSLSSWMRGARPIPRDYVDNLALLLALPRRDVWNHNRKIERIGPTMRDYMERDRLKAHARRDYMERDRIKSHARPAGEISREEIEEAMLSYLSAGGHIKKL